MPTNVIENEIVKLFFDNNDFERDVKTTMDTLDKLKDKIKLDDGGKSLESFQQAVNKVSFDKLKESVESLSGFITNRFSILGETIHRRVGKFIDSTIDSFSNFTKQFTVKPISDGFNEYNLKMGSVQTIMASTGESLEKVNGYLDELNTYADRTIYSFSDMTSNIGKFTNAGVKLEDAVKAIQGISNEAAVSGANAQEASRAMYNFAQALSAGYVKLIDWKSIENANMATAEFKDELIKTAVEMGTLVEVNGKYQSTTQDLNGKVSDLFTNTQNFNESLSHQWMTTDVLTTTLAKYADETTDLGKKAFAAATEVKTFSQLIDTIKEAIGSGWAKTFEIIIGDFNEAKDLFTSINDVVGKFVDNISDARNNLLEQALGPKIVSDEIISAGDAADYASAKFEEYKKIAEEVENGKWGNGAERLEKLTKAGYNYDAVMMIVNDDLNYSTLNMDEFAKTVGAATDATDELTAANSKTGRELLIESFANVAKSAAKIFQTLGEAYRQVFSPVTADGIRNAIEKFHEFTSSLQIHGKTVYMLRKVFEGVFSLIRQAMDSVLAVARVVMPILVSGFKIIAGALLTILSPIGQFIKLIGDAFHESDFLFNILNSIKAIAYSLLFNLGKGFKNFADILGITLPRVSDFRDKLIKVATAVADFIRSFNLAPVVAWFRDMFSHIPGILSTVATALKNAIGSIKGFFEQFKSGAAKATETKMKMLQVVGSAIYNLFTKLKGVWTSCSEGIRNFFSSFTSKEADEAEQKVKWFSKAWTWVKDAAKSIRESLGKLGSSIKKTFKSFKESKNFKMVFESIGGAVSSLKQRIVDWYKSIDGNGALEKFSSLFSKNVLPKLQKAGELLLGLKDRTKQAFSSFNTNAIQPAVNGVKSWYNALDGTTILEKLKSAFSGSVFSYIPNLISNGMEKIKEFYKSLEGDTPLEKLKNIPKILGEFYDSLDGENALEKFRNLFSKYITGPIRDLGIFERLSEAVSNIKTALSDVHPFESFKTAFNTYIVDPLKNTVFAGAAEKFNSLKEAITGIVEKIKEFKIDDIPGVSFFTKFTGPVGTVGDVFSGLGDKLAGAKDAIEALSIIFKTLLTVKTMKRLIKLFQSMGGVFETVGNAMAGMFKSISGSFGAVVGFFEDLKMGLNDIRGAVKAYQKDLKAKALLKTVGAIALFIGIMVAISFVPVENIKRGLFEICAALGALLIFSALFNKVNKDRNALFDVGKGVLAIAGGIAILLFAIKRFGKMDWKVMGKGMLAVAALLFMLSKFSKSVSEVDQTGTSWKTIIAFAASMVILSVAVKKLGQLDLKTLGKGLIAVVVLLLALSKTAEDLSKMQGAGKTMLALSVSMLLMYKAIERLGSLDFWTLVKGIGGFEIILEAFKGIINEKANIKQAIAILLTLGGSLWIITYFIERLSVLPIEKSMGVAIGLAAVIGAVAFALDKTQNMGIGTMAKGGLGLAIVLGELAIAIGIIVAIYAGIGYLIGKYMDEDTKKDVMEGLATLEEIGTSIGKFFGNIVGGFFEGIGNSLPQIATDLSSFMTNLQGFLNGCAGITEEHSKGIDTIMDMLGRLAVAEVWNSVADLIGSWAGDDHKSLVTKCSEGLVDFGTSLLVFDALLAKLDISRVDTGITFMERIGVMASHLESTDFSIARVIVGGRESLKDFGEELVIFADALIGFSSRLYLVSATNLKKAAECGQPLADLANSLPETSVLGKLFTGRKLTWSEFAEGMPDLAEGLTGASKALSAEGVELDKDAFQSAADCAIPLANLLNSLPKSGGYWQDWFGEKKWSTLTTGLPDMATALTEFQTNCKGLKYDSGCKAAVKISKELTSLLKNMPSTGGSWQDWFGEKKWSTLANDLPTLGANLTAFRDNVADLEYDGGKTVQDGTLAAVKLTQDLVAILNELPADGGILQSIIGSQSYETFGNNLEMFSTNLKTFCDNSNQTDWEAGEKTLDFVGSLVTLANRIIGDATLPDMTATISGFVMSMANISNDARDNFLDGLKPMEEDVKERMDEIIKMCIDNLYGDGDANLEKFHDAGEDAFTKYNGGIVDKHDRIKFRANEVVKIILDILRSKNPLFRTLGGANITCYVRGIVDKEAEVHNGCIRLVNAAYDALRQGESSAYNAGQWTAYGFCSGMGSKFDKVYNTAYNMGITAANAARRALMVKSPSRVFAEIGEYTGEGFAIGMRSEYDNVAGSSEEMGRGALDAIHEIVSRVNDILNGTEEFHPTITPVLDLTKVNEGVGVLGGLFSDPNMHLAIPGVDVLGGSISSTANVDIQDQVRQGVLEALKQNPINAGGVNNFYIDGHDGNADEIADAVIDKLNLRYNQRRAVFG